MSEHDRKFDAAMAELAATNMWPSNYASPMLKTQRRLGWIVRPPHYASFGRVLIGYALWFGPLWGIMMWFLEWRSLGYSVANAVSIAALVGLGFGLLMALYYARTRRKYKLSRWDAL